MIPTTNKFFENCDFFHSLQNGSSLNSSYRHEMLVPNMLNVSSSLQEKGNVHVSVKVYYTHKLN